MTAARHERQRTVTELLEAIGARARKVEGLRAIGARGRALSAIECDLKQLRAQLASIVGESRESLAA